MGAALLLGFNISFSIGLSATPQTAHIRLAPGDDKTAYERADYQTNSLSLEQRRGAPQDLLKHLQTPHLGLPPLADYQQVKPNAQQIALGRKLFFDRRLSRNQTMSCAMCHIPEQGFSNNELKRPIGFEGRGLKRNAPTLLNIVFNQRLFHDARENKLAQQAWSPLLAANEMNNPAVGYVIEQLQGDDEYPQLFTNAFGEPANMLNVGQALAQYQQTLVAANSPFDKWYFAGDKSALSPQQQRGFQLFVGKARCSTCHTINTDSALFTDQQLHSTGIGYRDSMQALPATVRVQIAPGITTTLDQARIASVGEAKENDLGRYEVTLDPADRWKFRTPTLRNIALTAPYMHNGELLSLADVIEFYNQGGVNHELLSPLIKPLQLSQAEQDALLAFLHTLTSTEVTLLVADAFAAPIGDPHLKTR